MLVWTDIMVELSSLGAVMHKIFGTYTKVYDLIICKSFPQYKMFVFIYNIQFNTVTITNISFHFIERLLSTLRVLQMSLVVEDSRTG